MNTFILLASLWTTFLNPPEAAKPWVYYWWLNGNVDSETITADLESMKELGFGSILLFDSRGYFDDDNHLINPPDKLVWGSPEWYDYVEFTIRECHRLGLGFTMNASASGGTLNGFKDGKMYETDILDKNAVVEHLERVVGPLFKRVPELIGAGKTFEYIYSVSYEGNVKTGGSWKTIKDNFYATMRDWAHDHGLKVYSESGGPWGWGARKAKLDCTQLEMLAHNDFPQGEFWPGETYPDDDNATRHSNTNGLWFQRGIVLSARQEKKPIISMEAFTHMNYHWSMDPAILKPVADVAFADGANRLVWHTFTCSPKSFGMPGAEYFAGTHINRNVTWQREAKPFISYLARCSALLQQGEYVDDGEFLNVQTNYYNYNPTRYRTVENAQFTMTHRKTQEADFFFVAGEGKGEVELKCELNGRSVELWDAVSLACKPAVVSGNKVTLDLPIGGSTFIVVAQSPIGQSANSPSINRSIEKSNNTQFTVSFEYMPGISAPPPSKRVMTKLKDWREIDDLKYFSGSAIYRTTFTGKASLLSLGLVPTGVAHVYVNKIDCGVVWCAPWEVQISNATREGENELEIRYTNNWHNRLIGDCNLPENERVTRSNVRCRQTPRKQLSDQAWDQTPSRCSGFCANDRLQPSGLLGPIELK